MPGREAASRWLLLGSLLAAGAPASACALERTGALASDTGQVSSTAGAGGSATTTGGSATTTGPSTTTTAATATGPSTGGGTSSGSDGGADSGGGGSASDGGSGPGVGGQGGDGGSGGSPAASTAASTATASSSGSGGSGGSGPVCGDGSTEGPEQCDDGGQIPGDRCDSDCLDENPDTCPGTSIPLAAGAVFTITDTTVGANDTTQDTQNQGSCLGSYAGPDLIYRVIPAASGTLNADLDAAFPAHFLVLRTECPSTGSDVVDCDYGGFANQIDHVEGRVEAGESYFIVVDSYGQTSGPFTLALSLILGS